MSKLYKVQTRFLFHSDIKLKIPIEFDDLYSILEEVNEKYKKNIIVFRSDIVSCFW